jgi:hypothetical protein
MEPISLLEFAKQPMPLGTGDLPREYMRYLEQNPFTYPHPHHTLIEWYKTQMKSIPALFPCDNCGGPMLGDGITTPVHCEHSTQYADPNINLCPIPYYCGEYEDLFN